MNNWKDPTDMTHDELIAEALTGNPDPLRESVTRDLAVPAAADDDPRQVSDDEAGQDERTRMLRAGLTVAVRMAAIESQAARDDGGHAHTETQWDLEEGAAEHQLGDLVNGDPQRWWDNATPAQICDAFLTARSAQGNLAMEAEQILATGLKDRYGIDVCDLDPEQVDTRDAAAQAAGWQRFAAHIERDMAGRWPDVAQAHSWPESADRRDGIADRLDATSPPGAATADQVLASADDAIWLFLEYRDQHGRDEDDAKAAALTEIADGIAESSTEHEAAATARAALASHDETALTGPCPCGGTFLPAWGAAHLDADGSAMVDTRCDQCGQESVAYFSWSASGVGQLDADRGPEVEASEPDRCSTCEGRGVVVSPAWRAWYDRQDDARKTWGANHRLGSSWSDTAEAKALDAAQPDEPEEISCTDCAGARVAPVDAMASMSLALRAALEGDHETAADHFDHARQATPAKTGRDDEAVEEDIRALLERTPRDNDITRPAQAGTETRESSPTATAPESGVEPTRRADDQANDAGVNPADDLIGDDEPSPVERAQRAVLELRGRRALEEQYAQARERDQHTVRHGHQRDGEPRSKAAYTDRGPVLSAFDD